jgi:DNA-binding NarL/FixJ family response regulator
MYATVPFLPDLPPQKRRFKIALLVPQPAKGAVMAHSILIVDDNLSIRRGLSELFQREVDFDVCGDAENGKEAIQKARELHPELIVLDLSMPIMNGLEAARILKRVMPKIAIIIYSVDGDSSIEREARSAGASALVSKSDRMSVLLGTARDLVLGLSAA